MSSTEKDLELKLRTMRYLWRLGYFVRKNIDLVEYGFERERAYTDIDVLGIKLDQNFNSFFVACDCKSGVRVKTAERLFWLSGVMKYFSAQEGLFVRNLMMETKYLGLSKRLGITPISGEQLSGLERTFVVPSRFFGPFCEEQDNVEAIFSELRRTDVFAHDYILKRYWKDTPQQQIVTLISNCGRIRKIKGLEDYKQTFILACMLSHLSLSILRLSKTILMIPDEQKETVARYELVGGEQILIERKQLLEAFYDFMVREIAERYKEKYPLTKGQFLENLLPEYSKYFVDLAIRFCQNPASSIFVPRIMDLFAFEFVLNNRKIAMEDVTSTTSNMISLKPFKDFLVFANRSNLTTKPFEDSAKEFNNIIESNV